MTGNPLCFEKVFTKNRNAKKLNLLGRLPFLEQTQYIIHQLEGLEALCIDLTHTFHHTRTIEEEPSSLMTFLPNGSFKSLEIILDKTSIYQRNMKTCFIRLVTELEENDRYFSFRVIGSTSYEVIESLAKPDFESSISDPTSLHWQTCRKIRHQIHCIEHWDASENRHFSLNRRHNIKLVSNTTSRIIN